MTSDTAIRSHPPMTPERLRAIATAFDLMPATLAAVHRQRARASTLHRIEVASDEMRQLASLVRSWADEMEQP